MLLACRGHAQLLPARCTCTAHALTDCPQAHTRKDAKYSLKASYVEIYNENVFDLVHFQQKSLPVKWDATYGFYVQVRRRRR